MPSSSPSVRRSPWLEAWTLLLVTDALIVAAVGAIFALSGVAVF